MILFFCITISLSLLHPTSGDNVTGILISGGDSNLRTASVEVFVPSTGQSCSLPNLPHFREDHTMHALTAIWDQASFEVVTVCGGAGFEGVNQLLLKTCISFLSGQWMVTHRLQQERSGHSGWMSEEGLVLMGGGSIQDPGVGFTSEILKDNGGSEDYFEMKYETWDACAIPDPTMNEVILTGGYWTDTKVSRYGKEGWKEDLPKLNVGRYYHACAAYFRDDGTRVLLVTGGLALPLTPLSSTEILVGEASSWILTGQLPRTVSDARAVTLANVVYNTGGYDAGYRDEIWEWSDDEQSWTEKATMKITRGSHAVSTIKTDHQVMDYCK